MAAQGQGMGGITARGIPVEKMLLPAPGATERAMDEEQGRGIGKGLGGEAGNDF